MGSVVARLLGVEQGALVRVTAAPDGLVVSGADEPPSPRIFRVVDIAHFGVRSLDGTIALADEWLVEALGGAQLERVPPLYDRGLEALAKDEPFHERARTATLIGGAQLIVLAFILGASLAPLGRKAWSSFALWAVLGVVAGLLLSIGEAVQGAVEIGSPFWYEALPQGIPSFSDIFGLWAFLPAALVIAAAAIGLLVAVMKTAREKGGNGDA